MEEEQAGNHKTRDFICACGKNYLSYAALFTHIKQKHDGKAPGPIVRPRSERKRGRPRKNPLNDQEAKNSDSDGAKNGISITNEINNNINIFEKKAKQAAQLLGCGQFKAFQAYRPESGTYHSSKNEKQGHRRPGLKKCVSGTEKSVHKIVLEESSSSGEAPASLKYCKSAPLQQQEVNNDHSSYQYNFVISHLQSLFENYQPTQQQYSCRQIIDIFDWMSQQPNPPTQPPKKPTHPTSAASPAAATPTSSLTIQKGFQMFLLEIQPNLHQFQFKQVSFLLSLFYDYISQCLGKPSNLMLGIGIAQFTNYVSGFLYQYLGNKVEELSVSCLEVFKADNSTKIMFCLCNWLSLRQMSETMKATQSRKQPQKLQSQSQTDYQQRNHIRTGNNQSMITKEQQKNEKCSSQEQIQFEGINDVLEMVREARETKMREQREEHGEEGHDQVNAKQQGEGKSAGEADAEQDDGDEAHLDDSSEFQSNQQQIQSQVQGSSECLDKKNIKSQKNVSCITAMK